MFISVLHDFQLTTKIGQHILVQDIVGFDLQLTFIGQLQGFAGVASSIGTPKACVWMKVCIQSLSICLVFFSYQVSLFVSCPCESEVYVGFASPDLWVDQQPSYILVNHSYLV